MASEASSAAAIRTKRLIRFFSPSQDRDQAQFPEDQLCSAALKLNQKWGIRASVAAHSRKALAEITGVYFSEHRRRRGVPQQSADELSRTCAARQ
jgi:hypothetical protein